MKKAIQHKKSYGSFNQEAVIMIEADESTPLLVDQCRLPECLDKNNNLNENKPAQNRSNSSSLWSMDTQTDNNSINLNKTFVSHFTEFKVFVFALALIGGLGIAVYLLLSEARLPAITFSLDLVNHDIWSNRIISTQTKKLNPNNIDNVIVMQTGGLSCDTSVQCLRILKDMQKQNSIADQELLYNFLIGGDGLAYEVRGWEYESGIDNIKNISQSKSLLIGVVGNFDFVAPNGKMLRTLHCLIKESIKRHKLRSNYKLYGLKRYCRTCEDSTEEDEENQLFQEIIKWSEFQDFLITGQTQPN